MLGGEFEPPLLHCRSTSYTHCADFVPIIYIQIVKTKLNKALGQLACHYKTKSNIIFAVDVSNSIRARDLAIAGNNIYLAYTRPYLLIFDVTTPSDSVELGRFYSYDHSFAIRKSTIMHIWVVV